MQKFHTKEACDKGQIKVWKLPGFQQKGIRIYDCWLRVHSKTSSSDSTFTQRQIRRLQVDVECGKHVNKNSPRLTVKCLGLCSPQGMIAI